MPLLGPTVIILALLTTTARGCAPRTGVQRTTSQLDGRGVERRPKVDRPLICKSGTPPINPFTHLPVKPLTLLASSSTVPIGLKFALESGFVTHIANNFLGADPAAVAAFSFRTLLVPIPGPSVGGSKASLYIGIPIG